jgi:hypothetical protein
MPSSTRAKIVSIERTVRLPHSAANRLPVSLTLGSSQRATPPAVRLAGFTSFRSLVAVPHATEVPREVPAGHGRIDGTQANQYHGIRRTIDEERSDEAHHADDHDDLLHPIDPTRVSPRPHSGDTTGGEFR